MHRFTRPLGNGFLRAFETGPAGGRTCQKVLFMDDIFTDFELNYKNPYGIMIKAFKRITYI
jgi:hypothetical protein